MVLVMAVSAMCMMAGCGNTVKDGTEALEQGDYDTAIASFEEAAGSDDKEEAAEGYCGLGMTYYEQKQYDQALEMLEKAFDNGTVKTAELCNLAGTSALCKEDYAKALEYMEENYMYRLTLSSISANVNLSSSYLCRIFKSEVGTSITNYLNNLRIRKAATLIKENTMSMKEISSMVGIDDQLYFSRLFKKCMGISPSEYGKKYHQ